MDLLTPDGLTQFFEPSLLNEYQNIDQQINPPNDSHHFIETSFVPSNDVIQVSALIPNNPVNFDLNTNDQYQDEFDCSIINQHMDIQQSKKCKNFIIFINLVYFLFVNI
jgi:hypothetical protein